MAESIKQSTTRNDASPAKVPDASSEDRDEDREELERAALSSEADQDARDARGEASTDRPSKKSVTRTPIRPAGHIRETRREIVLGLLTGVLLFGGGVYAVYWSAMRWLTRGGSSTVMAMSVLLPVTVPIVVGSIMGERGRKAFGYAIISGVMLACLVVAMWVGIRFNQQPLPMPGVGRAPLPMAR